MPMFSSTFDARVRADRRIGFFVPAAVLPGSVCTFTATVTTVPVAGQTTIVVRMFGFTATIPADRKVIFTVPADVPQGTYRFAILITVLATLTAVKNTTSPRSFAAGVYSKCHTIDEPEWAERQCDNEIEELPPDQIFTGPGTYTDADESTATAE